MYDTKNSPRRLLQTANPIVKQPDNAHPQVQIDLTSASTCKALNGHLEASSAEDRHTRRLKATTGNFLLDQRQDRNRALPGFALVRTGCRVKVYRMAPSTGWIARLRLNVATVLFSQQNTQLDSRRLLQVSRNVPLASHWPRHLITRQCSRKQACHSTNRSTGRLSNRKLHTKIPRT